MTARLVMLAALIVGAVVVAVLARRRARARAAAFRYRALIADLESAYLGAQVDVAAHLAPVVEGMARAIREMIPAVEACAAAMREASVSIARLGESLAEDDRLELDGWGPRPPRADRDDAEPADVAACLSPARLPRRTGRRCAGAVLMSLREYRRKVTTARAIQFTADEEFWEFYDADDDIGITLTQRQTSWRLWVAKHDEDADIDVGDWIIAELDGSGFYPCRADVFAATYEVG